MHEIHAPCDIHPNRPYQGFFNPIWNTPFALVPLVEAQLAIFPTNSLMIPSKALISRGLTTGFIHPRDFTPWFPPEGRSIGLFGFPLFGVYDVDNLAQDSPLTSLLWRNSDENIWYLFDKRKKIEIPKDGYLESNLNTHHYQKFQGKFYESSYLR